MKTIRSQGNPGSRTEVGNGVLAAAKAVKSNTLAPRLKAFEKAHAAYLAADERYHKAEEQVRRQAEAVGAADAAQDTAVEKLANALVADGLPRANPFKPLGFPAPAKLTRLGYAEEAREARRLAEAVRAREGIGSGTVTAAKALLAAAQAVEKALAPMSKLVEARSAAQRARDALGQAWETQFAGLKLAARMAAADGERDVFAALFEDTKPSRPRKQAPPPAQA